MALPRKGTILMPSGTAVDPGRKHLFVVCTDPCTACEQVIVPILTFTNTLCDQTCVISAKEHEFIKHKSYVSAIGTPAFVFQRRLCWVLRRVYLSLKKI